MRATPTLDSLNTLIICNETGVQTEPDVCFGDSNYLVAWSDQRSGTFFDIYAARVTPGGAVLDPNGFQLNRVGNMYMCQPSVAFDGSRWLVIWGYYYSPYSIMGRFVASDGAMSDTVLVASGSNTIYNTRLAFDGTNYLAVWLEFISGYYPVRGRLVGTDGIPACTTFTITTGAYYDNSLGVKFDGYNYLVTYCKNTTGTYQVWGRKYDVTGTPLDDEFIISQTANPCYYNNLIPGGNNYYLNVWSEYRYDQYDIFGNLDVEIVGIEENIAKGWEDRQAPATIFSGQLQLPSNMEFQIYNAAGRIVDRNNMTPGIYFLKSDGRISYKLIKIR